MIMEYNRKQQLPKENVTIVKAKEEIGKYKK